MRAPWKISAIVAFCLIAATGCGSGDGQSVTASISGEAASADLDIKPAPKPVPPVVLMKTSLGDVTFELDFEHVPLTVDNFLSYAEGGHYDQTIFHQVDSGFMILGGGYDADLVEKTTEPPVRNEAHNSSKNLRGTIAMARPLDVIDGAASQFFVNLADNPKLDFQDRTPEEYGYCVFGKVIEGLDVVDRIAAVPTHDTAEMPNVPTKPVIIESVRRVR